jgi:hypothetical protein
MRYRRRRTPRLPRCQGKVSYPSQRAALRTLLRCTQERGTSLRVYECEICDGWHLTKQAPREGFETITIAGQPFSFDTENLETWQ